MTIDTPSTSRKPPRAKPLQPDRPGRGDDVQSDGDSDDALAPPTDTDRAEESVARQKQQSDAALENVREGYDRH